MILSIILKVVADEKLKTGTFLYWWFRRMDIPDPVWSYCYLAIRSILLYRTGRLKESAENAKRVLQHPAGTANDQLRITGIAGCNLNTFLMRDENRIKELMAEMSALGEKYDSDYARGYAFMMSAFAHYQNRKISEASTTMEKAADAFFNSYTRHLGNVCRITQYLWDETPLSPEQRLKNAEMELNTILQSHIGHGYYELCQGMTGAIAKQAGDLDKAETLLLQAYLASHKKGACQSECGVLLHLTDLYGLRQDRKREQKYLRRWCKESEKYDFLFFWEMDYLTLVRVCARAAGLKMQGKYIEKLIRLYFGEENAERFLQDPGSVFADPSGFLYGNKKTDNAVRPVRFKLLGPFSMTIGEATITEKELKTRKISGILKYVLIHAGKPVSREKLAALFWPESEPKAAYASLRVALCELRKILARLDMGFESENALFAETKAGFEIAKGNLIQTDLQEFIALYHEYKKGGLSTEKKESALWRLNELYSGDFLEDSPYDEWISLLREQNKSIFIEAAHALSLLLIGKGSFHEAEAILNKYLSIDPFDEKACGMLLYVYSKTNQSVRAKSLRRQFEKRFELEMGQKAKLDSLVF